jgi:hypothetical protein
MWSLYTQSGTLVKPRRTYASDTECVAGAKAGGQDGSLVPSTYLCRAVYSVSVVVGPPDMSAGLYVDKSKIPTRGVGGSTDDLQFTGQLPPVSPGGTGDFRTQCLFSHMSFDDPIVYPGQPGKSHLHTFIGNTGANANSTAASLASSGNSTCRGGTINRTAYWFPTLVDTRDGTPISPRTVIVYYKQGALIADATSIKAMPDGLRMVAGDPKNSVVRDFDYGVPTGFSCISDTTGEGTKWLHPMPPCGIGSSLWSRVLFPQCWDGVNLDSPDHRSHMTYPSGPVCPATHPVAIPEITVNALYTVSDPAAVSRWRLASDVYAKASPAAPAGLSSHGDWFNGWKPDIVARWVKNCDQAVKDCQAHMLGDGWIMNEAKP